VEAATEKDRKLKEKIVVEHAENLEMAVELLKRLSDMKSFALEEKAREERRQIFMSIGVVAIGIAWKLFS
jgi:hypothetical protein